MSDRPFYDAVQHAVDNLQQEQTVAKVETFYSTGIPDMVSADNHTTYALVSLQGREEDLEQGGAWKNA